MAVSPPAQDSVWVFSETKPIHDVYTFGQQLGQPGQFGEAFLVTKKADPRQYFACKKIKKNRIGGLGERVLHFQALRGEIEVMRKLKHENLMTLHEVFEDAENLYLVMECCSGGELFDRIKEVGNYSEKDAAFVLRQIFNGLAHMHSQKIAHCDLKPDNFLFLTNSPDSQLKIIDFGMSKFCKRHQYLKLLCGTPYYVAPEVLREQYNEVADMWSMGVVTFVMLFGYPPFSADTDEGIFNAIERGFNPVTKPGYGAHFPAAIPCSDAAKDFMSRLLIMDPIKRMTVTEALEHTWLTGEGASSVPMVHDVLRGLTKLGATSKLKTALSRVMVSSTLSAAEVAALKVAFQKMDANGDGKITIAELEQALKVYPALRAGIEDLQALIKVADTDGDGSLDLNELVHVTVQKKLYSNEERLWAAFQKLDINGDGKISAAEIQKMLPEEDAASMAQMLSEHDKNGDGEIDYDEFLAMWGRDQAAHLLQESCGDAHAPGPVAAAAEAVAPVGSVELSG